MAKLNELFGKPLKVINMGLDSFSEDLKQQGVEVLQMDWRPPAGGNQRMAELLNRLKK